MKPSEFVLAVALLFAIYVIVAYAGLRVMSHWFGIEGLIPMSIVHIVINNKPLCGWTGDPPRLWPEDQMAVHPAEAYFCNCLPCVERMQALEEMQVHNGFDVSVRH